MKAWCKQSGNVKTSCLICYSQAFDPGVDASIPPFCRAHSYRSVLSKATLLLPERSERGDVVKQTDHGKYLAGTNGSERNDEHHRSQQTPSLESIIFSLNSSHYHHAYSELAHLILGTRT